MLGQVLIFHPIKPLSVIRYRFQSLHWNEPGIMAKRIHSPRPRQRRPRRNHAIPTSIGFFPTALASNSVVHQTQVTNRRGVLWLHHGSGWPSSLLTPLERGVISAVVQTGKVWAWGDRAGRFDRRAISEVPKTNRILN